MYDMPGLGVTPDFNRLNPSPTAPKIIGLAGYARAGKDTVAGIINRLYGHQVTSFSDILREFLYAQNLWLPSKVGNHAFRINAVVDQYGWEEARRMHPEIRELQQLTGTEAARNILGQTVWVDAWMRRVSEAGGLWVNPSVRFPNEAEAITAMGGKVYRIVKPGIKAVNDHPSDTALDGWDYDGVIMNDGTLIDLEGEVQRVLGEFDA
jgi:hypothetical protein